MVNPRPGSNSPGGAEKFFGKAMENRLGSPWDPQNRARIVR